MTHGLAHAKLGLRVEEGRLALHHAVVVAREIALKIEKDLKYPGEIKVTVIRETRAVEYAK